VARLRYSGIVLFISRILGLVTGMIFTTIVTRRLSIQEFGDWQYISVIFSYFILPSSFIGFWLIRHIARGEKLATTGLLLNLIFSIPATLIYIITAGPASEVGGISPFFFMVITPQISIMYMSTLLESAASGIKPHLVGYGSIVFECAKISLGAIFVLNMRLSLMGALISIEIAYFLQISFMAVTIRHEFTRSFSKAVARKWLMLLWLPLFSSLSYQMQQLDSLIVTIVTRSTDPIAMLKAAQVFSTIVYYSTHVASALYPRLLAGGGRSDEETSIRLVSLLALPSMFGAIVLADPLLAILKKAYIEAAIVLRISAITTAIVSLTTIAEMAILASEKIDISENVNLKGYLKSKLALIPILGFFHNGVYLLTVFVMASYLSAIGARPASIATAIAVTGLIVTIPMAIYKWRLSMRAISIKFPLKSIMTYGTASAVMSILILLMNPSEAVSTEVGKVILGLIPKIVLGGVTYIILITILDEEPKIIMRGFLRTIRASNLVGKQAK